MARLRSAKAPSPATATTAATTDATRRPILREKTNTMGTPGPAAETSMLALKNFKRRPRQGSMLEMVKHRRSSVARQSLAASVVQQQDEQEDTSVFDLGSASEDDEEAFAPEAEGTPIQLSKTRKSTSARKPASVAKSDAPASSAKRNKRKSGDIEESSHSALDALRKKHRTSEPSHVEDEELPAVDHTAHSTDNVLSDHRQSPIPDRTASEVQVVNSSPQHSSPLTSPASSRGILGARHDDFTVPSTEEQERAQTDLEEREDNQLDIANTTMADPASSSPIASPIPETQRTDIYADPQTQASPPPPEAPKTRNQANKKQTANLSTASLRALLPRRTHKPQPRPRRTEFDISSDEEDEATAFDTTHLEDDEDELNSRPRRQTKAPTQSKTNKKKPTTTTKRKPTKAPPAKKPTTSTTTTKAPNQAKTKATRKYGRGTTSDKENAGGNESSSSTEQGEEDTTLTMHEIAHSKELEEARRKFAEVDEWDLSFESMSNEDHRSSSQNWR